LGLSFFVCDGTVITSWQATALPPFVWQPETGGPLGWRAEAPVLTVSVDREDVERELVAGRLACPACGGMLARWGRARERQVRGRDGVSRVVPRRARCRGCQRTHVLLPVTCLARRADEAGVIGQALEAKAAGAGHRVIAEVLGRPASTVRGWLRALASRAEQVRSVFTALAVSLVTDPPLPAAAGSPVGDAVAAIAAAASAAAQFLVVGEVARWQLAAAATCGMLLAPGWVAGMINTSWPWAAGA
jgi:Domain of unknown function (DUF6431)